MLVAFENLINVNDCGLHEYLISFIAMMVEHKENGPKKVCDILSGDTEIRAIRHLGRGHIICSFKLSITLWTLLSKLWRVLNRIINVYFDFRRLWMSGWKCTNLYLTQQTDREFAFSRDINIRHVLSCWLEMENLLQRILWRTYGIFVTLSHPLSLGPKSSTEYLMS